MTSNQTQTLSIDNLISLTTSNSNTISQPNNQTSRRERTEWPSLDSKLLSFLKSKPPTHFTHPTNITPPQRAAALTLLTSEISKWDINSCDPMDNHIPTVPQSDLDIATMLSYLYYRGRLQSTVLSIYLLLLLLLEKGLVTLNSLRIPINTSRTSDATCNLSQLFGVFEADKREFKLETGTQHEEIPFGYECADVKDEAMIWLATMIVRSCSNLEETFLAIAASGFLGKLEIDRWGEIVVQREGCRMDPHTVIFEVNEREREDKKVWEKDKFGFWLPHGLGDCGEEGLRIGIQKCVARFDGIERAFKGFFEVGDEVLVTAEMRARGCDGGDGK